MRRPIPIALMALALAGACAEPAPLVSPDASAPLVDHRPGHCDLGVSDGAALAAITALLEQVDALEASGSLNAGQANALRNHLRNAQRALLEDRRCAAFAQLHAFREQVESFRDGGTLSEEEAAPLLDSAREVLGETPVFATVVAGGLHTCGLTASGRAWCWGLNHRGQLGDGTTMDRASPVPVSGALVFGSLAPGVQHTCGLTPDGATWCWGDNQAGTLGDGSEDDRSTPTAVQGGLRFASITAGLGHTCGVTGTGAAYCWGNRVSGALGDGLLTGHQLSPVGVSGGLSFTALSAGFGFTCGLTTTATAYCWGANLFGELGDGTTSLGGRPTPAPVLTTLTFRSIGTGALHACALDTARRAWCWGYNVEGELGDGTLENRLSPVLVSGGLTFDFLDSGDFQNCGITASGAAHCWGRGLEGQIGDGARENRPTPVPIGGGLLFRLISGGNQHGCGLATDDTTYCWGRGLEGQLGDGTTTDRLVPTAVQGGG